jgi:hypothetical protein
MEEKKVFQNIIRIDPNFTTIYGPQAVVSTVNIRKHRKPTFVQTKEMLRCRWVLEKDTVSGHVNCMRRYSGTSNAQSAGDDMKKSWCLCEACAILMREHGG